MRLTDLLKYRNCGLCEEGLEIAYALLDDEEFPTPRAMAEEYLKRGGEWIDVLLVASLLTDDKSWAWDIVRIVFEILPDPLNRYATTLGPDNWKEAMEATSNASLDFIAATSDAYKPCIVAAVEAAANGECYSAILEVSRQCYYTSDYDTYVNIISRFLDIAFNAVEGEQS